MKSVFTDYFFENVKKRTSNYIEPTIFNTLPKIYDKVKMR